MDLGGDTANDADFVSTKKKPRGSGKPPLVWFSSPKLPPNTQLGVWRFLFSREEQSNDSGLREALESKQLEPVPASSQQPAAPPPNPPDGGVALPVAPPSQPTGPSIFLCMIGGGHFAAMIVSLAPKLTRQGTGDPTRNATVIAHKTFHRYTTRRKQGGAQSANDAAKGAAHSAGSSLRRYNEAALVSDVRNLLASWRALLDTATLLFVRATGTTNRRTLFGEDAHGARPLRPDDPRLRGFPFSTRRATEGELMRCFVELTRAKVREHDTEAEARALAAQAAESSQRAADESARRARQAEVEAQRKAATAKQQEEALHASQITALIRRGKAPALLSYLSKSGLPADYELQPADVHRRAPTPLALASQSGAHAVVSALLAKSDADPARRDDARDVPPPYTLAPDRATRDAFRIARSELGEGRADWEAAGVGAPLTRAEADARAVEERSEADKAEKARREEGLAAIAAEEAARAEAQKKREEDAREWRFGKGRSVASVASARGPVSAEERRAEEARGMSPALQARMEREKRARAAEERIRRMQTGG